MRAAGASGNKGDKRENADEMAGHGRLRCDAAMRWDAKGLRCKRRSTGG
jgi:hypothetical protein